jgi:hypothetical protein
MNTALEEEEARKAIEEERNQERARAMVLAARVRALEKRLISADESSARPADYDAIAPWVEEQFAGRMKLLPRALRGLKSARFSDLGLVCDLLDALASQYVESKRGDREAWSLFQDILSRQGVEFSKSISKTRAGEQGDEYFVHYRGKRRPLEWHLKKGTSRDPSRDLRIYFFWDEEDEEVVVGSLPGHLDNRLT